MKETGHSTAHWVRIRCVGTPREEEQCSQRHARQPGNADAGIEPLQDGEAELLPGGQLRQCMRRVTDHDLPDPVGPPLLLIEVVSE